MAGIAGARVRRRFSHTRDARWEETSADADRTLAGRGRVPLPGGGRRGEGGGWPAAHRSARRKGARTCFGGWGDAPSGQAPPFFPRGAKPQEKEHSQRQFQMQFPWKGITVSRAAHPAPLGSAGSAGHAPGSTRPGCIFPDLCRWRGRAHSGRGDGGGAGAGRENILSGFSLWGFAIAPSPLGEQEMPAPCPRHASATPGQKMPTAHRP
eukprot:gene15669-biopygen15756